jgi:PLP dependent protein
MCIPPFNDSPDAYFLKLKKLNEDNYLKDLSMGMSDDFEVAIKLGSTYVRVGTAIFGKRSN